MRPIIGTLPVGVLVLSLARAGFAEPSWTKTGDCLSCHTAVRPKVLELTSFYTRANPNNHGRFKVVWAKPGETKAMFAAVSGLTPDDHYGVMLGRLSEPGAQYAQLLSYGADCDWTQWWSAAAGFFTDPPRSNDSASHYSFPAGPALFQYDLYVNPACPTDFFDLVYAVAGAPDAGTDFFYGEEHFYLYVGATAPPIVKIADFDCDTDVDLADFAVFQTCFSGPNRLPSEPTCSDADFDADGDVDLSDFAVFQTCFKGPNRPASDACPN